MRVGSKKQEARSRKPLVVTGQGAYAAALYGPALVGERWTGAEEMRNAECGMRKGPVAGGGRGGIEARGGWPLNAAGNLVLWLVAAVLVLGLVVLFVAVKAAGVR